jgi:oligosaccharide reducing-end xylanase
MKKLAAQLICLFFVMSILSVNAQTVPSQYELATWQGFRTCAVSYTFDDGCRNQFAKAMPIFDKFNYKMTLFTTITWASDWANIVKASKNGHEIANHTVTHPHIKGLSLKLQSEEFINANNTINGKLGVPMVFTMAYPYCEVGNDSLCKSLFIAARGCQGSIEGKTPANMMNVSSVICGENGSVKTAANFNAMAGAAAKKTGWLVYLIHGVDGDGGYSNLLSTELDASLAYLKAADSVYWVADFGTAARYVKERNCLTVTEISSQSNLVTLVVSDTLNNELYNTPITLKRALPEGWIWAWATQNDILVNSKIIEVNTVKYIQFDAVPDAGDVKLFKTSGVGNKALENSVNRNELTLWTRNNSLFFRLPETTGNTFSVSLYDMLGRQISINPSCKTSYGNGSINLPEQGCTPGIYIVKVRNKEANWTKQIKL